MHLADIAQLHQLMTSSTSRTRYNILCGAFNTMKGNFSTTLFHDLLRPPTSDQSHEISTF